MAWPNALVACARCHRPSEFTRSWVACCRVLALLSNRRGRRRVSHHPSTLQSGVRSPDYDKAGCFAKIMEHGAWGVLFETRHTPRHEPQLVQTSQRSEDAMNHAFPYSMRVILPRYPIIAVRPVTCATNWKTMQRPTRHAPCRVLTVWETSGLKH